MRRPCGLQVMPKRIQDQSVRVEVEKLSCVVLFYHVGDGERLERTAELESLILEKKPPCARKRHFIRIKDRGGNIQRWHFLLRSVGHANENIRFGMMPSKTINGSNDAGAPVARADDK